jgi:hypothetical protein
MRGDRKSAVEEPADTTETAGEPGPALPLAEVVVKRRRLELARIDVTRQLEHATAEAHREMLRRALRALDQQHSRLN